MDISDALATLGDKPYSIIKLNFATGYFSQSALIAKGSNALVYHAKFYMFGDGTNGVLVKNLDVSCVQDLDADDFVAQFSLVLALKDEHLIGLCGHCFDEDKRLLVYEYAPLGSLYDVLYGRKGLEGAEPGPVLTWAQRAKIAYGAAKGLEYLHEKVEPYIVHGEVRSSNVLVFSDFESKIGDFKLPRVMTGEITDKSDVYNFGVVLLELLTGRKVVDDTLPEEQQDLVTWATPYLTADKVEHIIDPKLNGDFPHNEVAKVAAIAQLCVQEEADFRPNMTILVRALEPLQEQEQPKAYENDTLVALTLEYLSAEAQRFTEMALVSKSSYGKLYISMARGMVVAVKKLDVNSQVSDADFEAQLTVASQIQHENLVELLGYCMEEGSRILVFELAMKGSLYDTLHGRKGVRGAEPGPVIPWSERVKIAYEAAQGLRYLHDVAKPTIVHGDVRSSNVLLFYDSAKIGDFNLRNALLGEAQELTPAADVYDFGIILLELLTGRKAVDKTMSEDEQDLLKWASSYQSGDNVEQMLDPKLDGNFSLSEAVKMAEMAWLCVQDEAALRPSMSTVVEYLESLVNLDLNDESCGTNVDKITNPDISDAMAAVELEGRSYQFFELNDTTCYFNPLTLLAKGSIASVYRADFRISGFGHGYRPYGVVKKLDVSCVQDVGAEDFAAQMSLASTLRNDYVIGLNGYCFEEDNLLLVYEYADLGSLHDILHGRKGLECAEPGPVLNWYQRAKIAYGAAKGLEYLHETVEPSIVHGEVRSSNVLVFYDFSAKIGDIMVPRVMTGEVTDKSDVYNFGVVLLELLTGRKAVDDTKPEEQQDLAKWATPYLAAENVEQIIDPRLNGKFPRRAVAKLAALVQLCIQEEPDSRPNMTTVVTALDPLHIQTEAFKLDDLNIATSRFSQMSLVAKRSYGELYCAILDTARLGAVKRVDTISSQVSEEDFVDQLTVVSKLKHDHFTELLGYCIEEDNRFLIYEFATAGSLYDVLHGVDGAVPGDVIPWDNRVKFAYEAAKGLEYLHNVAKPSIIHRDIRSSNIMLFVDFSGNYEAKIADFNLTNDLLDLDDGPDLNVDDSAEKKTWRHDVYDFGIVLLELVTGRKAVDNTMPEGKQDLVKWASSYQSGDDVEQMVDPRLNRDFPLGTVVKVAEIAWSCVQDEAALRPYMSTVVETLETLVNA